MRAGAEPAGRQLEVEAVPRFLPVGEVLIDVGDRPIGELRERKSVWPDAIETTAAAAANSFLAMRTASSEGIAAAAVMPMIETTIINSMRV